MISFEEYKRVYNNYNTLLDALTDVMEYATKTMDTELANIIATTLPKLNCVQKLGE